MTIRLIPVRVGVRSVEKTAGLVSHAETLG